MGAGVVEGGHAALARVGDCGLRPTEGGRIVRWVEGERLGRRIALSRRAPLGGLSRKRERLGYKLQPLDASVSLAIESSSVSSARRPAGTSPEPRVKPCPSSCWKMKTVPSVGR